MRRDAVSPGSSKAILLLAVLGCLGCPALYGQRESGAIQGTVSDQSGAVIPNADKTSINDIAAQRKELTERARSGKLKPSDVTGGTFTITNLGMYNVDAFNAIILPPQAAILAVGRISDRVVAVNGQPAVRPMMTLTLSGDHRVVDGAQAAMFLNDLAEAIRLPGQWIA